MKGVTVQKLNLSEKMVRKLKILSEGLDLTIEETLQSLIDSDVNTQIDYKSDFNHVASSYQATADLFTARDLEEVCKRIVNAVTDEFQQVDCGVILIENGKRELKRAARAGQYRIQVEAPLYLDGSGLVPEAIRTGKIVYASDVRNHPHYVPNASKTLSELVIPLETSRQVIGALDLQSKELDGFDNRNQWLIQTFAQHAAQAIENLMLYDDAYRQAEILEQAVKDRTAELQASRRRYQTISELGSDYAFSYYFNPEDGDFDLEWITQAFELNTGYSQDDIRRASQFISIVVEDDLPLILHQFSEMIEFKTEISTQVRIVTKTGEIQHLFVNMRPGVDENGQIIRYYGTAQDRTNLVHAEQKIREERNLLRTVINALPDHVYVKNLSSQFVLGNTALLQFLDIEDKTEFTEKTDYDFFPPKIASTWTEGEANLFSQW